MSKSIKIKEYLQSCDLEGNEFGLFCLALLEEISMLDAQIKMMQDVSKIQRDYINKKQGCTND